MPYTVIRCAQRTPEWKQARLGRLTGSRAADMLATIKTGEAAARRDLRVQLVCERLTGACCEHDYVNADMQRGIDLESAAIAAYEAETDRIVRHTGFLAHPSILAGCSLDGHVGEVEGIVEVKCPKSATHLRYLRDGVAPKDYVAQITHNLFISDAAWADFVSFDDRFPEHLQVFIVRVRRADVDLIAYERAVVAFLAEVEREVEAARCLGAGLTAVLEAAAGAA